MLDLAGERTQDGGFPGRRGRILTREQFLSNWGSEGTGDGQFQNLSGLATGSDGSFCTIDLDLKRVQKFE